MNLHYSVLSLIFRLKYSDIFQGISLLGLTLSGEFNYDTFDIWLSTFVNGTMQPQHTNLKKSKNVPNYPSLFKEKFSECSIFV
jgi:hypothetical protein